MAASDVTLDATGGQKASAPNYVDRLTIEGPASYDQAGGGYDIAAALALALPGRSIQDARIDTKIGNGTADGEAIYLHDTGKIQYLVAAGTEVGNGVDLTGNTHTMVVFSE